MSKVTPAAVTAVCSLPTLSEHIFVQGILNSQSQPCPTFCNPIPKGKDGLEPILAPRISGPGYFLAYNPSLPLLCRSPLRRDQETPRAGQVLNLHPPRATQAQRPEPEPQHPHTKPGVVKCICDPSAGKTDGRGWLGLGACQSCLGEPQVLVRDHLRKTVSS